MEPEFHYRVHKTPTLVPILNQTNPVYTHPFPFNRKQRETNSRSEEKLIAFPCIVARIEDSIIV
jgi:hypothetical protein